VLTEIIDDGVDQVERRFVYGNYIDEVLMMAVDVGQTELMAGTARPTPVRSRGNPRKCTDFGNKNRRNKDGRK